MNSFIGAIDEAPIGTTLQVGVDQAVMPMKIKQERDGKKRKKI